MAVGAEGAFTEGLKEFGALDAFSPGAFGDGLLDSTWLSVCSVGAGDCLALQPTVSPMPAMASPPTASAIPRVKPVFFMGFLYHEARHSPQFIGR